MQTTLEAIQDGGWEEMRDEQGVLMAIHKFVDDIEICLEPLIFDNQFYLAVYKNQSLLFPKIPMKPGKV